MYFNLLSSTGGCQIWKPLILYKFTTWFVLYYFIIQLLYISLEDSSINKSDIKKTLNEANSRNLLWAPGLWTEPAVEASSLWFCPRGSFLQPSFLSLCSLRLLSVYVIISYIWPLNYTYHKYVQRGGTGLLVQRTQP